MPKPNTSSSSSNNKRRRSPQQQHQNDSSSSSFCSSSSKGRAILALMVITIVLVAANLRGEIRDLTNRTTEDKNSNRKTSEVAAVDATGDNTQQTTTTTTTTATSSDTTAATATSTTIAGVGSPPSEEPQPQQQLQVKKKELDLETFNRRVLQAAKGLEELEARQAFSSLPFTTKEKVLQNGFPQVWNECTLEQAFQLKQSPKQRLYVSVVGGSTASRPGNKCPHPNVQTDGRFSTLLEQKLRPLGHYELKFEVRNLAQGGTTSVATSLLLDGIIDPKQTDIIVWDFLVNDQASSGGTVEMVRKLDFFLTRVHKLYAAAQRSPPAILLLYLWRNGARDWLRNNPTLNAHFAGDLIQQYIDKGWNIAKINIGAVIDSSTLRGDPSILLDDGNHPSCLGTNLIADMIQYLFYTNLQQCTLDELQKQFNAAAIDDNKQLVGLPTTHLAGTWANTETPYKELWNDLFEGKVGSISAWQPQTVNRTTLLNIENLHGIETYQTQLRDKADFGRDDRKYGFVLPKCKHGQFFLFPLREPNLKWLGLNVAPNIRLEINSQKIVPTKSEAWSFGVTRITHWIAIPAELKAEHYEIIMCDMDHDDNHKNHLQYLIGVSVPQSKQVDSSSSENNALTST